MFDKDGTGQLDLAELQEMKDSFKSKGAVRQEPTLAAPASKRSLKAVEERAGEPHVPPAGVIVHGVVRVQFFCVCGLIVCV